MSRLTRRRFWSRQGMENTFTGYAHLGYWVNFQRKSMEPKALVSSGNNTPFKERPTDLEKTELALAELSLNKGTVITCRR
jgi:hypothetical protein